MKKSYESKKIIEIIDEFINFDPKVVNGKNFFVNYFFQIHLNADENENYSDLKLNEKDDFGIYLKKNILNFDIGSNNYQILITLMNRRFDKLKFLKTLAHFLKYSNEFSYSNLKAIFGILKRERIFRPSINFIKLALKNDRIKNDVIIFT